MYFPVSGVEIAWYIPPLAAAVISFFTSMSGISGAFLLLPFQIEFLHYTSPTVSATNQVYNLVSIPSGLYVFYKEKRLHFHLAKILTLGALPGIILGTIIRSFYLTDGTLFKKYAACLLLYIAFVMLKDFRKKKSHKLSMQERNSLKIHECNYATCSFEFANTHYTYDCKKLMWLSCIIGLFGSIYGIGGGALLAPFLISLFKLPIYITSAATLFCTFASSLFNISFYYFLSFLHPEAHLSPDLLLGLLFGIGGFIGMNLGAKAQKYFSTKAISLLVIVCIFFTAFLWLKPLLYNIG